MGKKICTRPITDNDRCKVLYDATSLLQGRCNYSNLVPSPSQFHENTGIVVSWPWVRILIVSCAGMQTENPIVESSRTDKAYAREPTMPSVCSVPNSQITPSWGCGTKMQILLFRAEGSCCVKAVLSRMDVTMPCIKVGETSKCSHKKPSMSAGINGNIPRQCNIAPALPLETGPEKRDLGGSVILRLVNIAVRKKCRSGCDVYQHLEAIGISRGSTNIVAHTRRAVRLLATSPQSNGLLPSLLKSPAGLTGPVGLCRVSESNPVAAGSVIYMPEGPHPPDMLPSTFLSFFCAR